VYIIEKLLNDDRVKAAVDAHDETCEFGKRKFHPRAYDMLAKAKGASEEVIREAQFDGTKPCDTCYLIAGYADLYHANEEYKMLAIAIRKAVGR
jgi:hypothetical protein